MKKLFVSVFIFTIFFLNSNAQYFQGSFALGTNDTIAFKIKPVGGNITTAISYMEFAFRFITSQAPTLTTSAPVNNTTSFGNGLNVVSFPPNYVEAPYTYIKFVHNTGTIPSTTYIQNTEYTVFKVKLNVTPTAQIGIQMASNLASGLYVFGVIDGAGNLIDPGNNAQLYGLGYAVNSDTHTVPLISGTVGVKFLTFNAASNGNAASLSWSVAGENSNSSNYSIERSSDGTQFLPIGQIAARKQFNATLVYNFEDKDFYKQNYAYYRIRQNDDNGAFTLSNVLMLKNNNSPAFVISPNPSKTTTTIVYFSDVEGVVDISVIDASGKLCKHLNPFANAGLNKFNIDVSQLASGTYNLIINKGSIRLAGQLIKQ